MPLLTTAVSEKRALPQWAAAYAAADDGGLGETRPTAVALKAHRSSKRDTPYRGGAVGTPQLGGVVA